MIEKHSSNDSTFLDGFLLGILHNAVPKSEPKARTV